MPNSFTSPFELRNTVLAWLSGGVLGFTGIFVCLSCVMIMVMRYDNSWLSGIAMLFFPFLLVPVGLLTILFMFGPFDQWKDDGIYKNGVEYLIHQSNVDGDAELTRTVKTHSPHSAIRYIWQVKNLSGTEEYFARDTVLYDGKKWIKEK